MTKPAIMMVMMMSHEALAKPLSFFTITFLCEEDDTIIPGPSMRKPRQSWDSGVDEGQQRPLQSDMSLNFLRNGVRSLTCQGIWSFASRRFGRRGEMTTAH